MNLRNLFRLAIILVVFACWSAPADALELFTNFNNGMEFNTRPYGMDELPPVRYHSGQPGPGEPLFFRHRCRDSMPTPEGNFQPGVPEPIPAPRGNHASDGPIQLRATPSGNREPAGEASDDGDWLRGTSFLPSRQ